MSGKRFLRASLAVMAMVTPPVRKWYQISYQVCAMRAMEAEAHAPRARKLHARGPGRVADRAARQQPAASARRSGPEVACLGLVRDTAGLSGCCGRRVPQ